MYALTLKEQQEDRKLKILERKAAKRIGKIPQRTFEKISPAGQTVIKTTMGDRGWLVTLSKVLAKNAFASVEKLVKGSASLSEFLSIAQRIEEQYDVRLGLVPDSSMLYRPTIARERRVLKSLAA